MVKMPPQSSQFYLEDKSTTATLDNIGCVLFQNSVGKCKNILEGSNSVLGSVTASLREQHISLRDKQKLPSMSDFSHSVSDTLPGSALAPHALKTARA